MSGAGASGGAQQRLRILVVDDDPTILTMIATMLRSTYDVVVANDGLQALEVLERDPLPNMVVTDAMMPKLDGFELITAMKQQPRLAKIPVLMLTAKTDPRSVITGINAGARHYLTKPFKTDELLGKIRKTLGR